MKSQLPTPEIIIIINHMHGYRLASLVMVASYNSSTNDSSYFLSNSSHFFAKIPLGYS